MKEKTFHKFYETLFEFHANKYSEQNESNKMALLSRSSINLNALKKAYKEINMEGMIVNALAESSNIILNEKSPNKVNHELADFKNILEHSENRQNKISKENIKLHPETPINLKRQMLYGNLTTNENKESTKNRIGKVLRRQKKFIRDFFEVPQKKMSFTQLKKNNITKFKQSLIQKCGMEKELDIICLDLCLGKSQNTYMQEKESRVQTRKKEKKILHQCFHCNKKFILIGKLNDHLREHGNNHV